MGTTLSGIYFNGKGKGYVFNVGDSRVYLLRQKQLKQITRDHSLVAEMVENGELTQEEAFNHPQKNMLTRGIGVNKNVDGDVFAAERRYGRCRRRAPQCVSGKRRQGQYIVYYTETGSKRGGTRWSVKF